MSEPTPHDLARGHEALSRRLDREYDQLRAEMNAGFTRVERAIEAQRYVSPDLFRADQLRQDDLIADVKGDVIDHREETGRSIATLRNQFVGGLLVTLVVASLLQVLT